MNKNTAHYHITTFGYQMNESDSEPMAGILDNMGFISSEVLIKLILFYIIPALFAIMLNKKSILIWVDKQKANINH